MINRSVHNIVAHVSSNLPNAFGLTYYEEICSKYHLYNFACTCDTPKLTTTTTAASDESANTNHPEDCNCGKLHENYIFSPTKKPVKGILYQKRNKSDEIIPVIPPHTVSNETGKIIPVPSTSQTMTVVCLQGHMDKGGHTDITLSQGDPDSGVIGDKNSEDSLSDARLEQQPIPSTSNRSTKKDSKGKKLSVPPQLPDDPLIVIRDDEGNFHGNNLIFLKPHEENFFSNQQPQKNPIKFATFNFHGNQSSE